MQKYGYVICAILTALIISCASSAGSVIIADIDPFELGKVEAGFNKLFGSELNKQIIEVFYDARADEIRLKYKHLGSKFELYLKPEVRAAIIAAMDNYYNDFNERNLIDNKNKTNKAYGKITGRMRWGVFSLNAESRPEIFLGYRFIADNPYFALNIREAKNIKSADEGTMPDSISYIIWLNKAQSRALADFISPDSINSGLDTQDLPEEPDGPDKY